MNEEPFFEYSLRRGRPIRLMLENEEGKLGYVTVRVLGWDEEKLTCLSNRARAGKEKTYRRDRIFSASYARGDHGEDD